MSKIPKKIFQTWETKNISPDFQTLIDQWKILNPEYEYFLYDKNDREIFIKENFEERIYNAYCKIIPGAFKADLWRYCVLYKLGGIYLDIKYIPVNGFKFINLTEKEHWVLDNDNNGIYNALMVCKPGNKILLNAINQIVINVNCKYYGNGCLDPTGPHLLSKYFNNNQKLNFELKHTFFEIHSNRFINYKNYIIFKSYNGYLKEHSQHKKVEHYSALWHKKNIYK